jgi:hypothetical protein
LSLERHFGDINELVKPILAFKNSVGLSKEERLKAVLKEIPLEIGWVRALIPQYERYRGQSVQFVRWNVFIKGSSIQL